jgi:DNA invertase Pin-like site-specific DNA recombinase
MKTRAVAYYRCSKTEQEDSVERQDSMMREFLATPAGQEFELVRPPYVDDGVTGTTDQRADFQRMVRDVAERGDVDAVLVTALDRFSRLDPAEFFAAAAPLIRAGVRLVTIKEGPQDWGSAIGQVFLALQQMGKRDYSVSLSFNTTSGLARTVVERKGWPGPAPVGYSIRRVPCPGTNKGSIARLEPDEDAPMVREMFERYATGKVGLRAIADHLNARGVKAPRGGAWTNCSVRAVLNNQAYLGITLYNRRSRAKFHGIAGKAVRPVSEADRRRQFAQRSRKKRGHERTMGFILDNPESDVICVEGTHEPLVSRELFDRVQALLEERRNRKQTKKAREYVLARLARCAHCGSMMQGKVAHAFRHGGERLAYLCAGNKLKGRSVCPYRMANEDDLMAKVGEAIREEFSLKPDRRAKWMRRLKEALTARVTSAPEDARRLRKEIEQLERNVSRGRENLALLPADMIGGVVAKVREWEDRKAVLERRLADVERVTAQVADVDAQVEEAAHRIDHIGLMFTFQRRLFPGLQPELERQEQEMCGKPIGNPEGCDKLSGGLWPLP